MDYIPDIHTLVLVIEGIFENIFPEMPSVGVAVALVTVFLFSFYLLRAGLRQAVKISFVALTVMIFILFMVHSFHRLILA